jgi:hypothetical protein
LSLFSAKSDCGTPESWSASEKSLDHLLSQRLLLIALRSPSDQFQVVAFPLMCE